jgi:hypothetical protein
MITNARITPADPVRRTARSHSSIRVVRLIGVRHTVRRALVVMGVAELLIASCARIEPVKPPAPEAEVYEVFFLDCKAKAASFPADRIWVSDDTDLSGKLAVDASRAFADPTGYPPRLFGLLARYRDYRGRKREPLGLPERSELLADYYGKAHSHVSLSAIAPNSRSFTLERPQWWPGFIGRYHVSRVAFDAARRHALVTYCLDNGRGGGCGSRNSGATLLQRDGTEWKVVDSD